MSMAGTALDRDLQTFTLEMFERAGGVADWDAAAGCGTVVVPTAVAAAAHLPGEEFTLQTVPAPQSLQVGLAGEFLEVAARVLDVAVPRDGSFRIPDRHLTGRDLSDKINQTFGWQNARAKYGTAEPVDVEYQIWTLQGMLRSEDVWEGFFRIGINTESQAIVDLTDAMNEPGLVGEQQPVGTDESASYATAIAEGKRRLMAASADFVRRIEQRLERDRKRLQDYYRALSREAGGSKRKAATPPSAEEIAARKRAVDLELRRKLAELSETYALRAVLRPVVVARIRLQALVVPIVIQRKQAIRHYWNALLRKFEPLSCSRCRRATFSATFTNDTVDLLCAECAEKA